MRLPWFGFWRYENRDFDSHPCFAPGGLRIRAGRLASKSSTKDQAAFARALASLGSRGGGSSGEDSDSEDSASLSSDSDWARDNLDDAALADYAANAGLSDGEEGPSTNARIAALALGGEGKKGAPPKSTRFLDGDLSSDVQFEDGSSDEEEDEEEEGEEESDEDSLDDGDERPTPLRSADGNLPGPGSAPAGASWQWSTGGQGGPAAKKKKAKTAYPGEKARKRKDGIAAKRGERVVNRGFDPRGLADAMRAFIVGNGDLMALKPAGKLELKVTAALAALHGLRCTVQGSGKKRFAVLAMTRHAAAVDAHDPRLGALFRASLEQPRGEDDKPCRQKRRQEVVPLSSSVDHKARGRSSGGLLSSGKAPRRSSTGSAHPGRAMSFVSGGRIGGDDDKPAVSAPMVAVEAAEAPVVVAPAAVVADPVPQNRGERRAQQHLERERLKLERRRGKKEHRGRGDDGDAPTTPGLGGSHSAPALHGEWGSWEQSTTGFGSRILASMGYVPGQGLGSAGQGRAEPILVTRRPKAQGLGC